MVENSYGKKMSEIESIDSGTYGYSTENVIVKNREDLRKIIEEPCLPSCLVLYDKNIRTVNSSANKREIGGQAYIGIDYDSLDENNKRILEDLIARGIIEQQELSDNPQKRGGRDITIKVPVTEEDTVGTVSDKFMAIIRQFEVQDVLYGRRSVESVLNEINQHYQDFCHPNENGEVEFEEIKDIITSVYTDMVYDEETDMFWETKDLLDKHKQFINRDKDNDLEKIDG